ncbi:amidohydrolase [Agrobacterium sp. MA01]|uniref:amidohydrolase n=1 Tax=Agrobacterium sp. MA01 TaxID=2664893 RepID=UPI00129B6716|nr:amidohydrolase [Agrobacterium sp. MA01]QGG91128.1 amidohydrolase [Agrobacterium sp. MA01]
MFLTNRDVIELQAFRHELHRHPEVSGEERETARRVVEALQPLAPSRIVTDLGGHGVAAVFDSGLTGPTLLIRAELDALPIEEKSAAHHRSTTPGKGHLCGHDGHSTILLALARGLSRQPVGKGRVVLLWQPAEEDGSGAAAVLADPRFEEIRPDFAYSLHNMPGLAFGTVALKSGPVNCASRGMKIKLSGKTAHASQPETGISPMAAMSRLMPELTALSHGAPPSTDFTLATVTHASLGEQAFGIAPGDAEIWVTLRTLVDERMADLCAKAEHLVAEASQTAGLQHGISYHDIFFHCENAPEAVAHLEAALQAEGIRSDEGNLPMRASEDFGRLRAVCPSAMFFLGAGENHPALHNPDYDYPDDLTAIGARVFMAVIRKALG